MLELALATLGYGKAALKWLGGLPWYVLVIAGLMLALAFTGHEWGVSSRLATRQADQLTKAHTDNEGFKRDLAVDGKSIADLEQSVAAQSAAVDAYKAQSTAAQLAASNARARAARDAQGRVAAVAELKAAQRAPVLHDCAAPPAHSDTKGQL